MKILQISSAGFLGGGERYLSDLTRGLTRRGHELFVALRPGSPLIPELPQLPNQNLICLPLRNALDAYSASRLSHFVKNHRIQIVHAHMARDYPLAAYAVARNQNAHLIITRHVLFPLSRLHKLTLGRVARVIAVSEAVALQLRAERTVPEDRIAVVPNGIELLRFEQARSEFDRARFFNRWNLPAEALLIGTIGELKPLKGQEEFLRAAAIVVKKFPNAYFIIAGLDSSRGQQNRRTLDQLVDELGLREHVRFFEWLEDVAVLHSALDLFVSASRSESFGLAIVEAMATRTPVVATMTAGAKEIVIPEETGLLVPVGSVKAIAAAITELLGDAARRERSGNKGAEVARERFSLDRMVKDTEKIYSETLSN